MCYTATQISKVNKLKDVYQTPIIIPEDIEKQVPLFKADGFAHPNLWVLINEGLQQMQWGLIPNWNKPYADMLKMSNNTLNARSETIRDLVTFKSSIINKRCIIPLDGFFEYKQVEGKKLPYFIYPNNNQLFNVGGIFSNYKNPINQEWITTFSIITEPANEFMSSIHNTAKRMPLILKSEMIKDWINPNSPASLIDDLLRYTCDNSLFSAHQVKSDLKKAPNNESVIAPI